MEYSIISCKQCCYVLIFCIVQLTVNCSYEAMDSEQSKSHHYEVDTNEDNVEDYPFDSKIDYFGAGAPAVPTDADVIKRLLGDSAAPKMSSHHQRRLAGYSKLLYDRLEELEGQIEPRAVGGGTSAPMPIIRSYRGTFERKRDRGKVISFSPNISHWQTAQRAEFVLKVDSRMTGLRRALMLLHKDSDKDAVVDKVEARIISGYLVFDITHSTTLSPERIVSIKNVFYVDSVPCRTLRSQEPLLVLYENHQDNPLLRTMTSRRKRSFRDHLSEVFDDTSLQMDTDDLCERFDWTMNLNTPRFDWLLLPHSYNAGYCSGECRHPLGDMMNATNYSFLKNLYHHDTYGADNNVAKACCTPATYNSLTVMYISTDDAFVFLELQNMAVATCGCR